MVTPSYASQFTVVANPEQISGPSGAGGVPGEVATASLRAVT
jgi:hypothetical protein